MKAIKLAGVYILYFTVFYQIMDFEFDRGSI